MKRIFSMLLMGILPAVSLYAQDCMGLTFKPGANYEIQMFSAKDKPTGQMTYTIKNVHKEGANTVIDVGFRMVDDKGKGQPESTLHYICMGNELVADLSSMAGAGQNPAFKDMEMRMKANSLIYPKNFTEGQTLKDGIMETEIYKDGSLFGESNIALMNRQVGAKESITTPAGTFNAYKISSDMAMKNKVMGISIPVNFKTVSYRTSDMLFDVRTETYNKNGKLMGYQVLSKVN